MLKYILLSITVVYSNSNFMLNIFVTRWVGVKWKKNKSLVKVNENILLYTTKTKYGVYISCTYE